MKWYLISSKNNSGSKGLICLSDEKAKQMRKNKNCVLELVKFDIKVLASDS